MRRLSLRGFGRHSVVIRASVATGCQAIWRLPETQSAIISPIAPAPATPMALTARQKGHRTLGVAGRRVPGPRGNWSVGLWQIAPIGPLP